MIEQSLKQCTVIEFIPKNGLKIILDFLSRFSPKNLLARNCASKLQGKQPYHQRSFPEPEIENPTAENFFIHASTHIFFAKFVLILDPWSMVSDFIQIWQKNSSFDYDWGKTICFWVCQTAGQETRSLEVDLLRFSSTKLINFEFS